MFGSILAYPCTIERDHPECANSRFGMPSFRQCSTRPPILPSDMENIVPDFSNELDVAGQVRTTDPLAVEKAIDRIYLDLYPQASGSAMHLAFRDCTRMFRGEFPGYRPCDTPYHDIQHTMEVTLAMARLIDGYERSRVGAETIKERLFQLGVITALFHDCGYIIGFNEGEGRNGAEFTFTHVSRGSAFLKEYLPTIGMDDLAEIAAKLIHFTGYEQPVSEVKVPGLIYRLLGNLLGSADIIAQMADRCYLEKCRDRLYPEFVAGGIARQRSPEGEEKIVFSSGADLVLKTPGFYHGAEKRLTADLAGCYVFAENHFGGQNLYIEEIDKNIGFAQKFSHEFDVLSLRRTPPETLGMAAPANG